VQALLAALDEADADARRDPLRRAATTQLPALAPTPTPMPVLTPQAAPPIDDAPLAARTPTVMFQAVRAPTRSTPWPVVLALVLVAGGGGYLAWRANEASAASKPAEQAPATAPTTPAPTTPAPTTPAPTAAVAAPVPVVAPAPGGPVLFRINSIPTGATVKVGTKVVGQTPTTFPMDPDEGGEATAELTLELKGYQTITFIATSPGPRFDLVQRLQKGAGRVSLPALVAPRDEEVKAAAVEEDVPAVPVPVQVPTLPQVAVPVPQQAPVAARVAGAPVPGDELTTRPRLLSGAAPRYSESARVAKVEGTAIARCVVTARGRLDRCRMLKSVPLMDEAVLESLLTRVYEPGRVGADAVDSELNIVVKISR
jgi:serine/threonine-protein kinase